VIQAGWLDGRVRYGFALRGPWREGRAGLESDDADGWLVVFAYDQRRQTVRRLEIQSNARGGGARYLENGIPMSYDKSVRDWALSAFRLLQRMQPKEES